MSTRLLITLADFPDYVPFSVNIAEALVNPHIREAQTMQVWPVLPAAVRTVLPAALATVVPGFKPDDPDAPEFAADATAAGWTDLVLAKLWYAGIRPLLVVESAREMLLWHGLHITPAGAQTISDPSIGAQPITGQQRAELRANMAAKCTHYRGKLETALRRAYPTAYSASCSGARRRPTSGGPTISAV